MTKIAATLRDGFLRPEKYTVWDDFRLSRQSWSDRVLQTVAHSEEERIDPRNFMQLRLRKTF